MADKTESNGRLTQTASWNNLTITGQMGTKKRTDNHPISAYRDAYCSQT